MQTMVSGMSITFPLSFLDVAMWLTIMSVIMLLTSELMPSTESKVKILINRRKFRLAAIVSVVAAIVSIVLYTYDMIL